MKQDIHPDYHKITVVMTDGTKYETHSTWGKEGDVLQLDVDPKTHPAWVGGGNLRKTGQMEKFQSKFGNLSMSANKGGAKKEAAPAAAKAAPKAAKAEKPEAKAEPKAEAKPEESK